MTFQPTLIAAHLLRKNPVTKDYEYLLLRRSSAHLHGTWQMVTGKIEKEEPAWQAALREIKEETALSPETFFSADFIETFYEASKNRLQLVVHFLAFIPYQEKVTLSGTEHDLYMWTSIKEAKEKMLFFSQIQSLDHIQHNFIDKEPLKILEIPALQKVIQKFHLGIYAVIEAENSILLVKKTRGPYRGMWDLPGGSPLHGETTFQTLQREVIEETGIELPDATFHTAQTFTVDYKDAGHPISLHHTCLIYKATQFDPSQLQDTIDKEDVNGCAWIEKSKLQELPLSKVVLSLID